LIAKDCVPGGTKENLNTVETWTDWGSGVIESQKILLADAQTSGGLLLCVSPNGRFVLRILKKHRALCAAVIGRVVRSPKVRIWVKA